LGVGGAERHLSRQLGGRKKKVENYLGAHRQKRTPVYQRMPGRGEVDVAERKGRGGKKKTLGMGGFKHTCFDAEEKTPFGTQDD